jgi:hypothetical protein
MAELLTTNQLIDALAGYTVTIDPATGEISVTDFKSLPAAIRLQLRMLKDMAPDTRLELVQTIWNQGKPTAKVSEDNYRCPACPERGRPAVETIGGVRVVCACECPDMPAQRIIVKDRNGSKEKGSVTWDT